MWRLLGTLVLAALLVMVGLWIIYEVFIAFLVVSAGLANLLLVLFFGILMAGLIKLRG